MEPAEMKITYITAPQDGGDETITQMGYTQKLSVCNLVTSQGAVDGNTSTDVQSGEIWLRQYAGLVLHYHVHLGRPSGSIFLWHV